MQMHEQAFPGARAGVRSRQPTSGTIELDFAQSDTAVSYLLAVEGTVTPQGVNPGAFDPNDISVRFLDNNITLVSGQGYGGIDSFDYDGIIRLFEVQTQGGTYEIRHDGSVVTPSQLVDPYDDACAALCGSDTGGGGDPEPEPTPSPARDKVLPVVGGAAAAITIQHLL